MDFTFMENIKVLTTYVINIRWGGAIAMMSKRAEDSSAKRQIKSRR